MLYPAAKIKQAIMHPDVDVRVAAVDYFIRQRSTDPSINTQIVRATAKYGWPLSRELWQWNFELPATAGTIAWAVDQLRRCQLGMACDRAESLLKPFLVHQDAKRLHRFRGDLGRLDFNGQERQEMATRLALAGLSPPDLWEEFIEFSVAEPAENDHRRKIDYPWILTEALAARRQQFAPLVLELLRRPTRHPLLKARATELAGEMRLKKAIPLIVASFARGEPDDTCRSRLWALGRLGSDAAVKALQPHFRKADAAELVEDLFSGIASQRSVDACLKLARRACDLDDKSLYLRGALGSFAFEAIEEARKLLRCLEEDDPYWLSEELLGALLPVTALMDKADVPKSAAGSSHGQSESPNGRWLEPVLRAPGDGATSRGALQVVGAGVA